MRGLIRLIIIFLAILRSLFFWNIKKTDPKKILIAHDLLLGDTLLLAPLMKRIQEKYPHTQKYVLAKPTFVPLFGNIPYGFKVLSFNPKSFLSVWRIFCCGPYDIAFIAGDNRYSWLARALGSRWVIGIEGDTPPWKNWMLDEAKSFDVKPATWADMMGRLIDGKNPKPYQKNEWSCPDIKKLVLPFDTSKPYVVCHLGASNALRFWPSHYWREFVEHIKMQDFEVVLTTGPGEEYLINDIDPTNIYKHVPGSYSIIEMWKLIESAALLVSSDTGIAHLAKIAFVPTITLYGPGSNLIHGSGDFWVNQAYEFVTADPYPCRDQDLFFRRKVEWLNRCTRSMHECKTPGACMEINSPDKVIYMMHKIINQS
jgi:ADP-heptose:LPS heptosyltransferase